MHIPSTMRLGILFSSGKDSTATLWYYLEQGWDIACLLSLIPENTDSFMFQTPDEALLLAQANRLELPIIIEKTAGEKEAELDNLKALIKKAKDEFGIEGIAAGALASDYQHERITRICHELDLKTFSPLWHKNQEQHMREVICAGFDVRITRVAADGLDKTWLGRKLNLQDVDKLVSINKKLGINVAGEGGEFETIVLDGPIFTSAIKIEFEIEMESENRGELRITKVE